MGATDVTIKSETSTLEDSQEKKSDLKQQEIIHRNEETSNIATNGAADDEPEEGEIVDDYEFIISSDEELCMRQRIEELEAKNEELEKIANISGNYEGNYNKKNNQVTTPDRCPLISIDLINNMDSQRAAQVPTDASSISSIEFPTPKKRKKRKSKPYKSLSQDQFFREENARQSSKHHPRHYQQYRDGYRKHKQGSKYIGFNRMRYDNGLETIYLDSGDSSDDGSDKTACHLSRYELRLALARSSNAGANQGVLRDRLEIGKKPKYIEQDPVKCTDTDIKSSARPTSPQNIDDDSDDSMTLEERELRLIALKSAVMKKHLARKKRDAEVAYSPSDFDGLIANSSGAIGDDDMDVVEIDDMCETSRNSMEISPVASPKLHLSPSQDENSRMSMATESNEVVEVGNTKPVDMDIANSESDEELPAYEADKNKWMPIEQIPLPGMNETRLGLLPNSIHMPYNGILYPTPIQYQSLYSELHMEPPPLPPGVTDFDLPPLPPQFHLKSPSKDLSEIKNIKFHNKPKDHEKDDQYETIEKSIEENYDKGINNEQQNQNHCLRAKEEDVYISISNSDEDEANDDEEEEEALRSLLLSKFNSPKNGKSNNNQNKCNDCLPREDSSREGEDPEALRLVLLTSISDQKKSQKPTEAILKEAVRRLTMKNCIENPISSVDSDVGSSHYIDSNSQSNSPIPIDTHSNGEQVCREVLKVNSHKSEYDSHAKESAIGIEDCIDIKQSSNKQRVISPVNLRNNKCEPEPELEPHVNVYSPGDSKVNIKLQTNERVSRVYNQEEQEDSIEIAKTSSMDAVHVNEVLSMSVDKALKSKVEPIVNIHISTFKNDNNIPIDDIKFSEKPPSSDKLDENKRSNANILKEMSDAKKTSISVPKASKIPVGTRSQLNSKLPSTSRSTVNPSISVSVPNTPAKIVPLHTKKFIKPNKVINTQTETKRKSIEVSQFPTKKLKSSSNPASPIPSASVLNSSGSRLITNADISAVKVKKLIITLRASDTETSEDEAFQCINSSSKSSQERFKTLETLECTINNDYYDNASPISLPMDSPANTPRRSNSPLGDISEALSVTTMPVGEIFEKKLDTFLKTVRSQVQKNSLKTDEANESNIESDKAIATPVAVRHLPHASQEEYRRLIHRMQMLEKQKQSKKKENELTLTSSKSQESANSKVQDVSTTKISTSEMGQVASTASSVTAPVSSSSLSSSPTSSSANGSSKTLFKKVLIKNASNKVLSADMVLPKTVKKGGAHQPSKSNVLRAYELSFLKTGAGIVSNLEKSLQLVEEAKQAKMAKLRYEKRLNDLRAELKEVEKKFKHEQDRMSIIFPQICESNEVITTLKQRRIKLFKAATSLGKNIKGDDYRLNNDLKHQISTKSKKLANEIKVVNSMKYVDIDNFSSNNESAVPPVEKTKLQRNSVVSECTKEILPSQEKIQSQKTENIVLKQLVETTEVAAPMNKDVQEISSTEDPLQERSKNVATDIENTSLQRGNGMYCEELEKGSRVEEQSSVMELSNENDEVTSKESKSTIHPVEGDNEYSPRNSNPMQTTSVREYISPLAPLKSVERQLDPHGIICPYDLMGECVDKDCRFVHIRMGPAGST